MLKNISLLIVSILVLCTTFEVISRIWLNYTATSEQYKQCVLYIDVPLLYAQYIGHPYLNYSQNPNHKRVGLPVHIVIIR